MRGPKEADEVVDTVRGWTLAASEFRKHRLPVRRLAVQDGILPSIDPPRNVSSDTIGQKRKRHNASVRFAIQVVRRFPEVLIVGGLDARDVSGSNEFDRIKERSLAEAVRA